MIYNYIIIYNMLMKESAVIANQVVTNLFMMIVMRNPDYFVQKLNK